MTDRRDGRKDNPEHGKAGRPEGDPAHPPGSQPAGLDRKDIDRRRDELLRLAAGEPPEPGSSNLTGLGLQFVVAILVCMFAGQWLDGRLGTRPWLMIAGIVGGAAVGFYAMIK